MAMRTHTPGDTRVWEVMPGAGSMELCRRLALRQSPPSAHSFEQVSFESCPRSPLLSQQGSETAELSTPALCVCTWQS